METSIIEFLVSMSQNYPWAMAIIVWFGVFRAVFKPAMTLLDTYVESTPGQKDNEWVKSIKASKVYAAVVWLVDYSSSIKLPK